MPNCTRTIVKVRNYEAKEFHGKIGDGDLRLLRVFCAVVRCGGFAAAESELQLGLPSISRYVKDLETRLGVRLWPARTHGLLADKTKDVKSMPSAFRLISHLEQFEVNIRSIHTDMRGTLEIGLIDALLSDPNLNLPEVLATFKQTYPSVDFSITTATSNVIEQAVLDGSAQVGIVIGRRHIDQLELQTVYTANAATSIARKNIRCTISLA